MHRWPVRFGGPVTLLSYNTQDLFVDLLTDNPQKLHGLSSAIIGEKPDVVLLQEVGQDVLEAFHEQYLASKGKGFPHRLYVPTNGGHGFAVLSQAPLKLTRQQLHHTSSFGENPYFSRGFLRLDFKNTDQERFTVYTVHLKSMRGGMLRTQPNRIWEATQLSALIHQQLREDPQARIIVIGDLNVPPGQEGEDLMSILRTPRDIGLNGQQNVFPNLQEMLENKPERSPTHQSGSILDRCILTSNLQEDAKFKVCGNGKHDQFPWNQSDHLPIKLKIQLPDPPPVVPVVVPAAQQPPLPPSEASLKLVGKNLSEPPSPPARRSWFWARTGKLYQKIVGKLCEKLPPHWKRKQTGEAPDRNLEKRP